MANRRMFSLNVVDTDHFLEMPSSVQLLYFHLGMRADDEGFIASPKSVIRAVNASAKDLAVLIKQEYIIQFDSGVCVVRHWLMSNLIQKDRFRATTCTEERKCLSVNPGHPYELLSDGSAAAHSA